MIRDFIGLSENAWDFTASGGVPGFGSLGAEDAHRLVAQVLSERQAADPSRPTAALADNSATPAEAATQAIPIGEPVESIAATQHEDDDRKASGPRLHHRHGGALPQ
jgi:hypothetical protein